MVLRKGVAMISKIVDPEKIATWKASEQYASFTEAEKEIIEFIIAGAFDSLMITVTTEDGKASGQMSLRLLAALITRNILPLESLEEEQS
jgi:hypothetical protein